MILIIIHIIVHVCFFDNYSFLIPDKISFLDLFVSKHIVFPKSLIISLNGVKTFKAKALIILKIFSFFQWGGGGSTWPPSSLGRPLLLYLHLHFLQVICEWGCETLLLQINLCRNLCNWKELAVEDCKKNYIKFMVLPHPKLLKVDSMFIYL